MKNTFILLYGLISLSIANAQVPGYMGKHMSIHVGAALSPSLNEEYIYDDDDELSSVNQYGLNKRLSVAAEYTLSKVVSAGFSFQHLPTNIPYAYYSVELPENPSEIRFASYFGDLDLKANFGSLFFKFYSFQNKGSIAPIGKYHKLEIAYGFAKASTGTNFDAGESLGYHDGWYYIPLQNFDDLNYQLDEPIFVFMYSFGSETVYFNKLIGDFNVQIGFVPDGAAFGKDNSGGSQEEFDDDVIGRISCAYFFNVNFGIGYFVF